MKVGRVLYSDLIMSTAGRLAVIVAIAVALVGGLFAAPLRYEVEGVSMGPGLLPGDVVTTGWVPGFDRRRSPARFDRWIVTLPDGSTGLKRLVGLPGEQVAIVAGDLAIDGRTVRKGPRLLAAMGSVVERSASRSFDRTSWSLPPTTVLDDASFAVGETSRLLLPVRDAGFAAEIDVPRAAGAGRIRAAAGPLAVTWRLARPGRYAVVAGRLDGQAVAAAWPLPAGPVAAGVSRSCLPPAPPQAWDVVRPWPADEDRARAGQERSPSLSLVIPAGEDAAATIIGVTIWRDILHRAAADGTSAWKPGPASVFVLGDFPSGSRDSRQFGPLPVWALRHRIR
jgi:type IV secretory pathway protease TraF